MKFLIFGQNEPIPGTVACPGGKFGGETPSFWEKAAFEPLLHKYGGSEGPSPTLRCPVRVGEAANSQILGVSPPNLGQRRYTQDGGAHPHTQNGGAHTAAHSRWRHCCGEIQDGGVHPLKMASVRMRISVSALHGRGLGGLHQSAAALGGGRTLPR